MYISGVDMNFHKISYAFETFRTMIRKKTFFFLFFCLRKLVFSNTVAVEYNFLIGVLPNSF